MRLPLLLLALACAGSIGAAEPAAECRYGAGSYTQGSVLCQAGIAMQCRGNEEGQALWTSLDRACASGAADEDAAAPAVDAPKRADRSTTASETPPARARTLAAREAEDGSSAPAGSPVSSSSGTTSIEILWAHYGRDGQTCDAAPALTKHCGGHSECEVAVSAANLCGDPFPGHPKLLSVYWQCSDGSADRRMPPLYGRDDASVSLSCT